METEEILRKAPRETAGSQSFRAFDFQVHASMARILDAFRNGENFVAYFDLFDDLIFLTQSDGKAAISFYQMKARADSPWTAKRLASRPAKGEPPKSIIGKAYHNLHEFGQLVRKAAIVSNQHLRAEYADGSKTTVDAGEILLSDLSAADHGSLVAAIEADFPDGIDPRHTEVLVFERIPLDLQSFRQTLLGAVTEFVNAIGPEYAVTAKPLYDALLSEITRCTGTVTNAKTLSELKRQKGLGQPDLQALVRRVQQRVQTPAEWWPSVESELVSAGWQTVRRRRLYVACLEYRRARDRGTRSALDLCNTLTGLIEEHPRLLADSILRSMTAYKVICTAPEPDGELYTLQAALLVELMESIG